MDKKEKKQPQPAEKNSETKPKQKKKQPSLLMQSFGYLLRNTPGFDELPKLRRKKAHNHGKDNKQV